MRKLYGDGRKRNSVLFNSSDAATGKDYIFVFLLHLNLTVVEACRCHYVSCLLRNMTCVWGTNLIWRIVFFSALARVQYIFYVLFSVLVSCFMFFSEIS